VASIDAPRELQQARRSDSDVAGTVIETSRGSFYQGFGANAVGAGSPAVPGLVANFHFTDAIFQPKIAERTAAARQFASQAAQNDALLRTALAYQELLRAAQDVAIANEAKDHAQELARVTGEFARTGQGLESDNDQRGPSSPARMICTGAGRCRGCIGTARGASPLGRKPEARSR
jgi:hypothetical protein